MRQSGCRRWLLLLAILLLGASGSCAAARRRATWYPPEVLTPRWFAPTPGSEASAAELAYAEAYELELDENAACVDLFFQAAVLAWWDVEREIQFQGMPCGRGAGVYRAAVVQLISAGQRFRRFDPKRGLMIWSTAGWQTVPTSYRGFAWRPEDIDFLIPVGDYTSQELTTSYRSSGLGVPTVAVHFRRPQEKFRRPEQAFAATVVLRPTVSSGGRSTAGFVLELNDPLRVSHTRLAHWTVPIVRDITAPIAFRLSDAKRGFVQAFLRPGQSTNQAGLYTTEPYQRGKIPIVFVHGLLSDPFTWASIANEIRASPELNARYQIWGFEYATGEPFLLSAAALRRQLRELRAYSDPYGQDPALCRVVLVGHSMGGLVSKLQVAHSSDMLWRSVSQRPLDQIVTTPATRIQLAESFFFDPSPTVSRVVFVGTPHRGSPWASRPVGVLGSSLVEQPSSMESDHHQLIRDNPDVFSTEFERRIPTSIDLLRSDSPLLQAIECLPIAPHAKLHSVIGTYRRILGGGESDGVVPVSSARHHSVVSEKFIEGEHRTIHKNREGVHELLRILREHLMAVDLS